MQEASSLLASLNALLNTASMTSGTQTSAQSEAVKKRQVIKDDQESNTTAAPKKCLVPSTKQVCRPYEILWKGRDVRLDWEPKGKARAEVQR